MARTPVMDAPLGGREVDGGGPKASPHIVHIVVWSWTASWHVGHQLFAGIVMFEGYIDNEKGIVMMILSSQKKFDWIRGLSLQFGGYQGANVPLPAVGSSVSDVGRPSVTYDWHSQPIRCIETDAPKDHVLAWVQILAHPSITSSFDGGGRWDVRQEENGNECTIIIKYLLLTSQRKLLKDRPALSSSYHFVSHGSDVISSGTHRPNAVILCGVQLWTGAAFLASIV